MTTFNIKTCDNRDITVAACHYGSHVVYIDTSDDRLAKKFTNRAPGEMDACFGFISELGQAGFSVILYNIQRDSESSEWMHVALCNTGKPETILETEIDVYLITGLKNMVRRFVDPLRVDVKGGMISAILSQDCSKAKRMHSPLVSSTWPLVFLSVRKKTSRTALCLSLASDKIKTFLL
tara:strand:- start:3200 stop:3736 length:537 start_codon:yes stop_codon:yes gene_type:complete